jgi:hypothetical protein
MAELDPGVKASVAMPQRVGLTWVGETRLSWGDVIRTA